MYPWRIRRLMVDWCADQTGGFLLMVNVTPFMAYIRIRHGYAFMLRFSRHICVDVWIPLVWWSRLSQWSRLRPTKKSHWNFPLNPQPLIICQVTFVDESEPWQNARVAFRIGPGGLCVMFNGSPQNQTPGVQRVSRRWDLAMGERDSSTTFPTKLQAIMMLVFELYALFL